MENVQMFGRTPDMLALHNTQCTQDRRQLTTQEVIFYRKRKLILDTNSTSRITSSCSTSLPPFLPFPSHLTPLPFLLLSSLPSLLPLLSSLPSPPQSSPRSTLHAHVAVSSTPLRPAPHGRGRQCENTLSSCVGPPQAEEDDHDRHYLP